MAEVSWFEEHSTPSGSSRRSTGRTSSKFKRAARRLARQGHAAQAGKFAELAESARMLEPSTMRPEFRELEGVAQGIKALEDEAIASGIDFEKDIAPLRGEFFQAINDAGSLSGDEKQMLRDRYGKGFKEDALAVDERAAQKAQRDVAQKQADAAAWKQGQAEKDAKLERKALKKMDEITESMTEWRLKNPNATATDTYAERRKKVRDGYLGDDGQKKPGVSAKIQNTEAWTKDNSRRVTEHSNEITMEQRAGQAKLQTASVVADALRGITIPIARRNPTTGVMEEVSVEQQQADVIHQYFPPGSKYAEHARRLALLNATTQLSTQKAAAAAIRKEIRTHYAGVAKDLDTLRDKNLSQKETTGFGLSTTVVFGDPGGLRKWRPKVIINDLRQIGHRAYGGEDPAVKKLLDAAVKEVTSTGDAADPSISIAGANNIEEAYNLIRTKVSSLLLLADGKGKGQGKDAPTIPTGPTKPPPKDDDEDDE